MIDPANVEGPGFEAEGTASGSGFAFDALLGGSPAPGFTLGGGVFVHHTPKLEADDMEGTLVNAINLSRDIEFDSATLTLLAPFVNYYPDARGGLNFTGAVGLALLGVGDGTVDNTSYVLFQDHGSGGLGMLAGVGYDWWVSRGWSLGVQGRVLLAAPSGEDDDVEWQHHVVQPGLMLTATMN